MKINELLKKKSFKRRLNFLQKTQFDNKNQINEYQTKEFVKLIKYAYKNVDFYKNYFVKHNLKLKDFTKLEDIIKLPIIDKSIINEDPSKFISKKYKNKKIYSRTTGGSSGEPLTVYFDQEYKIKDLANTFFYMSISHNLDPLNYRSIRLYGDKIKVNKKQKIFWKKINSKKYIYSSYHINDNNIKSFFKHLNDFKPAYIHGRPSSLLLLCNSLERSNLIINFKLKCIFLDGEVLPLSQRKKIEKILNTKVYLTYGHTEGSMLGFSCGLNRKIHFAHQVGIVEVIKHQTIKNSKKNLIGEVIVTGFNNKVMPLIRYNTKDIVKISNSNCKCNRKYLCAKEIIGRKNSYVYDKKGQKVMIAPVIFNYDEIDWTVAKKFKIVQNKIGELVLNIVPIDEFQDSKIARIVKKIERILDNNFKIKLSYQKDLKFTTRGKFNYVEQKIKNK